MGRRPKYLDLIMGLDDQACYTAATIVKRLPVEDRERVRLVLGSLTRNHPAIFKKRDGEVRIRGKLYYGWFGWRWKLPWQSWL
ncbi:MAG: hypothetical protein QNK37_20640 [Acidobacteriota bacterium]|nr:hypothetical protein [Acidobacteriota bacterium]